MKAVAAAIQHELEEKLNPAVLDGLHGRVRLCWSTAADACVAFSLRHGEFLWLDANADTDVTFFFDDDQLLLDVLCGSADPIEAFMRGRFRSSGYLLWTFPLLSLFRGPAGASP